MVKFNAHTRIMMTTSKSKNTEKDNIQEIFLFSFNKY